MPVSKGVFSPHKRTQVTFDVKPGVGDMVWIDQSNGVVYNYDDYRKTWLSASKDKLEYARKGAADGMYLPLLGDLDNSEDVYLPGKPSIIVGIFCRSKSGDKNKIFEIRKNGELLYNFSYDGSDDLLYINNLMDIAIEAYDRINVYVTREGTSVRNTVCRIETARRYDI